MNVVRLLGRLNLSLRGHSENEESKNKGVFREIIEFFAQSDPVMDFHLKSAKS